MRRIFISAFALIFIFLVLPRSGDALDTPNAQNNIAVGKQIDRAIPLYKPGELIVKIKKDRKIRIQNIKGRATIGVRSIDALNAKYKAISVRSAKPSSLKKGSALDDVYVFDFDSKSDIKKIAEAYRMNVNIEYAEPNYIRSASYLSNDPFISLQWNFDNASSNDSDINLPEAWDYDRITPKYGGDSSIVVAVIDTGVAFEDYGLYVKASDFANTNFASGYDYINDDSHPNDDHGHGTHVAGTIAQSTDNLTGVAGIAFNTTIMPIKALGSDGTGTVTGIASAIDFAREQGAEIISMSLGSSSASSIERDAVSRAVNAGIVVIAATGNDYASTISYPAAYDGVIAVGATRYDATLSPYSNYGTGIDIVAPGGDTTVDQNGDEYADGVLQQTFYDSCVGNQPVDVTVFTYCFFQGTSMATPHVSGVAALLMAQGVSAASIDDVLFSSARDLGDAGYDTTYGHGILDAEAALALGEDLPLSAPVIIAKDNLGGQVVLQSGQRYNYSEPYFLWQVVTYASGYYVYFGTDANADPTSAGQLQTANDYQSAQLSGDGIPYYFKVRAIGGTGQQSDVASFTYIIDNVAQPVSVFSAEPTESAITLSWTAPASDIASYSLYRAEGSASNQYSLVQSALAGTSYTDSNITKGINYFYTINSVDALGNQSISSASVQSSVPIVVSDLKAEALASGITLSWTSSLTNVASYSVYRSESENGEYSLIKSGVTTGSYIDVTAEIGKRYYYKLKSIDTLGHASAFSSSVNAIITAEEILELGESEIVVAPREGFAPLVKVFSSAGKLKYSFYAFNKNYRGGVSVACGDVDADGYAEIIVAPMQKNRAQIRVFEKNGALHSQPFYAYETKFKGGARVASGDIDGDDFAEIITGPGKGTTPRVRIFDKLGNQKGSSNFFAFNKSEKNGVNVSASDLDGDKRDEIVASVGNGGSSEVRVFLSGTTKPSKSFYPYGKKFKGGVFTTIGDSNDDGIKEIITGKETGTPEVRIFQATNYSLSKKFFPYSKRAQAGVTVASGDVNSDGRSEIIAAQSVNSSYITVLQISKFSSNPIVKKKFYAYSKNFKGGIRIAVGNID